MSDFTERDEPIQYALGEPARRTGLGGLSLRATVVLAIGFGGFLLLQLAGLGRIGFTVVFAVDCGGYGCYFVSYSESFYCAVCAVGVAGLAAAASGGACLC